MEARPQEVIFYTTEKDERPFELWLESLRDRKQELELNHGLIELKMETSETINLLAQESWNSGLTMDKVIAYILLKQEKP